jgi:hypothetical protein
MAKYTLKAETGRFESKLQSDPEAEGYKLELELMYLVAKHSPAIGLMGLARRMAAHISCENCTEKITDQQCGEAMFKVTQEIFAEHREIKE